MSTVNASGGLEGHQVQLVTEDDAGTPGTSVTDIHTLIGDHVDALLDLSLVDETWESTIQAANIPVVGGDETSTPYYTNPDFYPEGQTNDSVNYAKVATAKAAGATNLAYFFCAESSTCAESVPVFGAIGKSLNVPLVYKAEISATAPNYTAQCVAAKQDHVTALYIGDSSAVIARAGLNCQQQDYNPIYVIDGEAFGPLLLTAPGIKDNLWAGFGTLPYFANSPAVQAMNSALDKYEPGVRTNQATWSELGAEGWASGILMAEAVKASGLSASGTPSAAQVIQGLDALKGDTLDGWAPPLTFAPGKPHPVDCWFTAHVKDGVASLADGGKLTCSNSGS